MPEDQSHNAAGGISPEDEIRRLEEMLVEKKRALAQHTEAESQSEHEVFRDVMRERMEQAATAGHENPVPQLQTLTPPVATLLPAHGSQSDVMDPARGEQLRALVEVAMTNSIEKAVDLAQNQTPWLLDALHDRLTTVYYEKLLQLRRVTQL